MLRNKKVSITISILTMIVTPLAIIFTDVHMLLKLFFGLGFILAAINLYSKLIMKK